MFEMFDLNEENFINLIELEFLLNTTLTSIYKINRVKENIKEDELTNFVNKNFAEEAQLNFDNFYKWTIKNKYIQKFMQLLN